MITNRMARCFIPAMGILPFSYKAHCDDGGKPQTVFAKYGVSSPGHLPSYGTQDPNVKTRIVPESVVAKRNLTESTLKGKAALPTPVSSAVGFAACLPGVMQAVAPALMSQCFGVDLSPLLVGLSVSGFLMTGLKTASNYVTAYQQEKSLEDLNLHAAGAIVPPSMQAKASPPIHSYCSGFPTEHSAETSLWREKMIRAAEHNIILSGNFCHGVYYTDVLQLIEKQMEEKPNLQVIILVTKTGALGKDKKNNEIIKALTKKYPTRFAVIENSNCYAKYPNNELKIVGNHTKCLVIDYGKYYMLGGSGIKAGFTTPGKNGATRADYLREMGIEVEEKEEEQKSELDKLINASGGWRDMDFVMRSEDKDGAGKAVYQQSLLLATAHDDWNKAYQKWKKMEGKQSFDGILKEIHKERSLNFLKEENPKKPPILQPSGNVVNNLLQRPIPKMGSITTEVPGFDAHKSKTKDVHFQLLCTGPEMEENIYAKTVLSQVEQAERQIVIKHMYFDPSDEILEALVRAAKRGVKITIITNGLYGRCETNTKMTKVGYRGNSGYQYSKLLPYKNVEIFEYDQSEAGYHKKVIIADDTVIAGSSNFGYKSLGPMSDHELNFVAHSSSFAEETLKVCEMDKSLSKRITTVPWNHSLYTTMGRLMHLNVRWQVG